MNAMLVGGWLNLGGMVAVPVHLDMADLRERMARLEGRFEGFAGRQESPAA